MLLFVCRLLAFAIFLFMGRGSGMLRELDQFHSTPHCFCGHSLFERRHSRQHIFYWHVWSVAVFLTIIPLSITVYEALYTPFFVPKMLTSLSMDAAHD